MNRSDLIEHFSQSVNQAWAGLYHCIDFAPDSIVFDKSLQTYVRGPKDYAQLLKPDARRYLAWLRSLADDLMDRYDTGISERPSYAASPTPARGINPINMRSVTRASRRSDAVKVKNRFCSRPESSSRWIAPHAIVFDGYCWQTRAFCKTNEVFKDFLLQHNIQTHEGKIKIEVRKVLPYCWLKRLMLDTDLSALSALKLQYQQIVLISSNVVFGEHTVEHVL